MWFKNLTIYRLPKDFVPGAFELAAPRPMGPFDRTVTGWIPPALADDQSVYRSGDNYLLNFAVDEKILPASVIREQVKVRAAALAVEQGYPVGRRQTREIREAVTQDLMKVALVKRRTVRAWINLAGGWFVVDTPSTGRADEVVSGLREVLGSFAVQPYELSMDSSPHTLMGAWLRAEVPGSFELDDTLELRAADKTRAAVKYARFQPDFKEVTGHLSSGKYVTQLGLTWAGRVAFRLNDKAQVRGLQFLDIGQERSEETKDAQEQFDSDAAIMFGELSSLISDLAKALGATA